MGALFRIIWRLIMVTIGFYLAGLVAGLTLFVGNRILPLQSSFPARTPEELLLRMAREFDRLGAFTADYALPMASFAAGYWLIFAILTEILSVRSILIHLTAGGAVGYAAFLNTFGNVPGAMKPAIAAGIAGALVYWIVAGHGAGLFRRKPATEAPAGPTPDRYPAPPPEPVTPPPAPRTETPRPMPQASVPTIDQTPALQPPVARAADPTIPDRPIVGVARPRASVVERTRR
jgi:hypothetical protein